MSVPSSRLGSASTSRGKTATDSKQSDDAGSDAVLTERTVINEALIRAAVREEMLTEHDPSCVPEAADIDLPTVETLALNYRNIYRIDNLVCFDKLIKLQLDNNIIEKIENIDHLTQLQWLDLSFNRISKIENLEKLINLTDLSLFSNRIEKIEGEQLVMKRSLRISNPVEEWMARLMRVITSSKRLPPFSLSLYTFH